MNKRQIKVNYQQKQKEFARFSNHYISETVCTCVPSSRRSLQDVGADQVVQESKLQMYPDPVGDDIYKRIHIYSFLFSNSIDTQVHLVSLETYVL